jgi:hypothetical protein
MIINKLFYFIKPLIPRRLQLFIRRQLIFKKLKIHNEIWPIDPISCKKPENWEGWPNNKKFALVLTHDVESDKGQQRCLALSELEMQYGFRSSFNFVPKRYNNSPKLKNQLQENGFEVGVHGLYHDGKLYSGKNLFQKRAVSINQYLNEWGSVGFRSPAMHHNLDWIHQLNIDYDASTFDTDPFEPQADAVRTIFPFFVHKDSSYDGYIELPYTLPQDFTLYILMGEKNVNIWKRKLDWIADKGGMALVNVHPDYMNFGSGKPSCEEYPAEYYAEFLDYIKTNYNGCYWHVLPKEIAVFWKALHLHLNQ